MAEPTRFSDSEEPIAVFQDDYYANENSAPIVSHAPMPSAAKPARRHSAAVLAPSTARNGVMRSPLKPASSALGNRNPPPPFDPRGRPADKLASVSMKPPAAPSAVTDSMPKKQPSAPRTKAKAVQRPDQRVCYGQENGQENGQVPPFAVPQNFAINFENYHVGKDGKKRVLEPNPDESEAKKPRLEPDPGVLPSPDGFPPIHDDGTKPPHSYAQLIAMAILRSPNQRLPLNQIYQWISSHFSFYVLSDTGWQNSIRHNLSLHKNFLKNERPKDDPGKGNYWTIMPGTESQFLKDKPQKRSAATTAAAAAAAAAPGENVAVMSARIEQQPKTQAQPQLVKAEHDPPAQPPASLQSLPPLPTSQATLAPPPQLSSDATIPVSDGAQPEETTAHERCNLEADAALARSMLSPLAAAMHSSPPIPRMGQPFHDTPPPPPRAIASSVGKAGKRNADDSGYISSLESSAMRKPKRKSQPAAAKKAKGKKGVRAEDEIRRIRGSSIESPSRGRSGANLAGAFTSSPHNLDIYSQSMPPPLTPASRPFLPLLQPPQSKSPRANLLMHREAIKRMNLSPCRGQVEDAIPYSPSFHLDTIPELGEHKPALDFEIYQDAADFDWFGPSSAQQQHQHQHQQLVPTPPKGIKPTPQRPRHDRSLSAGALGDLGFGSINMRLPNLPDASLYYDSPIKADGPDSDFTKFFQPSPLPSSPVKAATNENENVAFDLPASPVDNWLTGGFDAGALLPGSDGPGDFDMLKCTFSKIGGPKPAPGRPSKPTSRNTLGRSNSMF